MADENEKSEEELAAEWAAQIKGEEARGDSFRNRA